MKYSQKEMLEEGFWDFFKPSRSPILRGLGKVAKTGYGLARGVTKGGEYLARTLAPEITNPIDNFGNWTTGLKDAISQGFDLGEGGKSKMIEDLLAEHGWVLDKTEKITKKGPNIIVFARRAIGSDANGNYKIDPRSKAFPLLIDKYGNISNSAYLRKSDGKNPAYPYPSK